MFSYVYVAIGSVALVYIVSSEMIKSDLEADVDRLQNKLNEVSVNYITCSSSISKQNKEIDFYKLDILTKKKELLEWKSKPAKVRYETIYKEVIRDNNLTGGCDEVKDIINSVSSINLNSL